MGEQLQPSKDNPEAFPELRAPTGRQIWKALPLISAPDPRAGGMRPWLTDVLTSILGSHSGAGVAEVWRGEGPRPVRGGKACP